MSAHALEMDERHNYWCVNPEHTQADCAGVVFKSVTTILGKAVPKDLAWHGQTRGIVGVKGLMRRKYDVATMSVDQITDALKREHLTVNDHRDAAGVGGTVVHKMLEDYATKGIIPSATQVPEAKRASIRGLAKFIIDYRPKFLATEVKVVSVKHAYAGTFDLDAIVHAEFHQVPKRGGKGDWLKLRPTGPDGQTLRALIDMKNSRWVYPASHFTQLEGYEGARLENGMEPTDVRAVLWLNAKGHMELVPSVATFDDFLKLRASAEVNARLEKSWQRPRKAKS